MRALAAGFQTHMSKPVDPADLITVIAGLAGRLGKNGNSQLYGSQVAEVRSSGRKD
jgi:hypothetical protein